MVGAKTVKWRQSGRRAGDFQGGYVEIRRECVCDTETEWKGYRKGSKWCNGEVERAITVEKKASWSVVAEPDWHTFERCMCQRTDVKRVVQVSKRDAHGRWGRRLDQNFRENKTAFWKEVKRASEAGKCEGCRGQNIY